ncbi:MAG: HAD-IA family hydrolase [Alphaproteobacteria bacterium]|nr:HAD-IA family hydrolase [Alphaproteobacteria bacterium]
MRLIIFDCDGTLVDSQKSIMNAIVTAWESFGLNPPKLSSVLQVIGLTIQDSVRVLEPDLNENDYGKLEKEFYSAFVNLNEQAKIEEELFPNVVETLNVLNDDKSYLAVLTGKGNLGLQNTFKNKNIGEYFIATKTSDCGPGKPNPQTMNELIAELGVEKESVVMIGDTTHDILTAKNAGVKSIGVSFGYHSVGELVKAGANEIVDDFSNLPSVIDTLLGS